MDRDRSPAIAQADDADGWRLHQAVPDVDIAREIGSDHGAVHPRRACQTLWFTAVQRNPEELPLEGGLLPTNEVELPALLVQGHRRFGRPLAPGELPDQRAIGRI